MPRPRRTAVRDKWKIKKWYKVLAPPLFGNAVLGTTPADDPDKLIGRVLEVTLYDLTGEFTHVHIKLYFQVERVEGDTAYTRFKGHELLRDYIKSLTRRKSSKIQGIFDVWTKDGYGLRITVITFTSFRCKSSQKKAIRKVMEQIVKKRASESTLDEFIQSMIFSENENSLVREIESEARKIYSIRKVEVYKSKLLYIKTEEGIKKAVIISPLQQRR
ncbi:MAG: 30S ribosomal protein S3ae [Desulfurococcales archaeon]|nr:30S ribosomal protein S3ae [Desulfurococcales archaeon]